MLALLSHRNAINASNLPVVRYILPYPRAVVTRSMGKYVNKYGYN